MAIYRLGHIVSAVSGSLGGAIYKQTRNGPVIARRPARRTAHTKAAHRARARIANVTDFWNSLTDEQKATWSTAARSLPFKNRLGHTRYLTGRQLYIKNGISRFHVFDEIDIFPPINGVYPAPSPMTLTFTAGPGPYTITTPIPHFAPAVLLVWASRPIRSTLLKHWPSWTYLRHYFHDAGTSNVKVRFDAELGAPAQGEAVAIKARLWESSFWTSHPVIASTVML